MNIFICHCWQDKTTAELLACDIKPLGNHVVLAQDITPQTDLAIIVWTKRAANSENVSKHITNLSQQESTLLPCQFDDTPLPGALKDYPATDMRNYQQGFPVLVKRLYAGSKTEQLRHDDFTHIQQQIAAQEQALEKNIATNDYLQDRYALQQMLLDILHAEMDYEVTLRHRHRLQQLLNQVQLTRKAPIAKNRSERDFLPTPAIFAELVETPDNAKLKINFVLQSYVDIIDLARLTEQLHYYLQTAGDMLGLMYDITFNTPSEADKLITRYLIKLANTSAMHNQEFQTYMCNLCTVAWLIHNSAGRLVEAGLIPIRLFPFDWEKIISTDLFIVNNLTNEIRHRLEALLLYFMEVIALEVNDYQPHLTADNDDYHVYPLSPVTLGIETELA